MDHRLFVRDLVQAPNRVVDLGDVLEDVVYINQVELNVPRQRLAVEKVPSVERDVVRFDCDVDLIGLEELRVVLVTRCGGTVVCEGEQQPAVARADGEGMPSTGRPSRSLMASTHSKRQLRLPRAYRRYAANCSAGTVAENPARYRA